MSYYAIMTIVLVYFVNYNVDFNEFFPFTFRCRNS